MKGASAAWLHDLLKPHVSHLVVCDPRKNALLPRRFCAEKIFRGLGVASLAGRTSL